MQSPTNALRRLLIIPIAGCLLAGPLVAFAVEADPPVADGLDEVGVRGGLCVQVGAKQTDFVAELAQTGRFLVHVLDRDEEVVDEARRRLSAQGLYGLVSVDRLDAGGRLPYAEYLVNLLVVLERSDGGADVEEIRRVVCPNGVVLAASGTFTAEGLKTAGFNDVRVLESPRGWTGGRQPWPAGMDTWSHSRHSASGNAVSQDTLVGPPRRVRWLAGPWQEVSNMVTADGRNYYGGLLARDSFNGLRLWQRPLTPSKSGFNLRPLSGVAPPVAGEGSVFLFTDDKLQAVDGLTGKTLRQYPLAGKPQDVLYDQGVLIAVGANDVRGFDAESGRLLWTHEAAEPRYVVAGDDVVGLIQGSPRRGEKSEVVGLDKQTGEVRWRRDDLPWASHASRCVYYQGMLTFEVSTLNDDGPGNAIHIVTAADGKVRLDYDFLPGMNHRRQARAMFVDNTLWLLHGGKDADKKRRPTKVSAIDYLTGEVRATHAAGLAHCFPPVATPRYLFSGELDMTDLRTGNLDANRITKAACGRDNGWVPANGLIYVTPKHCVCWPMLRGYAAMAAARVGGNPALQDADTIEFPLEHGVNPPAADESQPVGTEAWPCYRHDAWRSGSTPRGGPSKLNTLWSVDVRGPNQPEGPITQDWKENPFVKGPITPPVIAGGRVYVARPDAHEVVALNAATGQRVWAFTANGRVDTPPTIHRGLCLFGAKSGWVYCLRAGDGQLVWRLQAAPLDERIVAYGGLESPWPVPGSVLVVDDVAYFAAGRQSLADGGILVFAADPATGKRHWVSRLDSVPQQGFYESSGLEFDNFDLLFRQGDSVAMSRWQFDRGSGQMSVQRWDAFAPLNTGGGTAMVPQGCWSYAPRNQKRTKTFTPRRPLVVFRDNVLFGCLEDKQSLYRRDFDLAGGEKFDPKWITGWAGSQASQHGGVAWRSQRLAEKAKWTAEIYDSESDQRTIDALVLAGDKLYLGGSDGEVRVISASDGKLIATHTVPAPLWDGLAIADGRLFVATRDGQVLCLGD